MKIRNLVSAAGLGLGLLLAGGAAQASLLSFEDDDIDFILSTTGGQLNAVPKTSGTLDVGDVFVSVFEIDPYTLDGANRIPAGQELTGVAAG